MNRRQNHRNNLPPGLFAQPDNYNDPIKLEIRFYSISGCYTNRVSLGICMGNPLMQDRIKGITGFALKCG